MKKLLIALLCLGFVAAAHADVTFVQKIKSGAVMGQPPQDTTMTMYIKGDKARIETGNQTGYQIIDLTAGKVYIVEPEKKQAMVMTTEMMKQTAGMMAQMAGGQKSKPNVEKLGTTHTYNGHKCEDVKVTMTGGMIEMTSVSCVSTDIDIKEFERFKDFGQDFAKAFGVDSTGGIPGFAVHSDTKMKMMGQNIDSTTELQSINHDSVPDAKFVVPPDYKLQDMKMPGKK